MDDRYKKRGLRFNNALDSRALRAVHNQHRQRERREDVVNLRRQIGDIPEASQVTESLKMRNAVDKKAERYQKGLERYQYLLKWKEMKKKQLEKEKKKRMPAFKTGVFHPSPPKFLVSEEDQHPYENSRTPFASLKKTMTPGTSMRKVPVFHLGGTAVTSLARLPQFHTGVTPCVSTKKQVPKAQKHAEQENLSPPHRTRGALKKATKTMRGRGKGTAARGLNTRTRRFNVQEDLGIKPLPVTPPTTAPLMKEEKPALPLRTLPSFAPADFAFNFEAPEPSETKQTKRLSTGSTHDTVSSKVLDASLEQCNAKKEDKAMGKEDALLEENLSESLSKDVSETGDSEAQYAQKEDLFEERSGEGTADTTDCKTSLHKEVCRSDNSQTDPEKSPLNESHYSGTQETGNEKSPHKETHSSGSSESGHEESLHKEICGSDILDTSQNKMQSDSVTFCEDLSDDYRRGGLESDLKLHNDENIDENQVTSEQGGFAQVNPDNERPNLSDMKTSVLEEQGEDDPRPKKRRSATPAKYLTRRSASCCFDDTVTPVLSRLRPRTPCSRSTRRSLSAHCDMPNELFTPGRQSARKTPRRSVNKAARSRDPSEVPVVSPAPVTPGSGVMAPGNLTLDTNVMMEEAANKSVSHHTPVSTSDASLQKQSWSPMMTPENVLRREHGMWTVETSPWINLQRSKKKKVSSSTLQGVFDDIPIDVLPVPDPAIPSVVVSSGTGASLSEEAGPTNLLHLLEPSCSENAESPEVDVWGEESHATSVLDSPKTSRERQSEEKKMLPEKKDKLSDVSSLEIETVAPRASAAEDRSRRRKSRKSVMFAISEQEDEKTDTFKLPGTPLHASTRVSMGLFAKVDPSVDEPLLPGQDLIAFDSPMSEKKASRLSRRRSCRVSLLPGMTLSPSKEEAPPVSCDLMTWDSPFETNRALGRSAPSLATPKRRSRRLSKIM